MWRMWKIEDAITSFKFAIYNFCLSFPDTPPVPGYTPSNRNTMLDLAKSRPSAPRWTVSQYNNVLEVGTIGVVRVSLVCQ